MMGDTETEGSTLIFAMLLNPSNAKATFVEMQKSTNIFENRPNPVMTGTYWIALMKYSQMSTHLPGFLRFFEDFCNILYEPTLPPAAKGLKRDRQNEQKQ